TKDSVTSMDGCASFLHIALFAGLWAFGGASTGGAPGPEQVAGRVSGEVLLSRRAESPATLGNNKATCKEVTRAWRLQAARQGMDSSSASRLAGRLPSVSATF